ncbi:MAG: NAD(P)/FAD-dependent oxidoreductase [Anaerovorax sp.]
MIYDFIIIGAGAAGLFCGASLSSTPTGLILEKMESPGKKLLMAGSGQCNITHDGSMKAFVDHYGIHGKEIRSILYQYNNKALLNFFQSHGLPCFTREDGKVFPKSLSSKDVLQVLLDCCHKNKVPILYNSPVTQVVPCKEEGCFSVTSADQIYKAKKLIIATGGCSYPTTGSDGEFFGVLSHMRVPLVDRKPALVPIHVYDYPYGKLSGISFSNVRLTLENVKIPPVQGDLLFTYDGFSGPGILSLSRYAAQNQRLLINYLPHMEASQILVQLKKAVHGNTKQLPGFFQDFFDNALPKRFLEVLCSRLDLDLTLKASQLSGTNLKEMVHLLTADRFSISGLGGYGTAMVTSGGVSLKEVNLKTLESKLCPHLYFAGEVLDVDGDTGGYNLQFAFSCAYLVAQSL